ncbi:hypothetical protein QFZ81_006295 [Paenibacillus sp. V4I9]|nr:hypothetical protein [Paenibacillus sp. V4I9]MDQ0891207.1 hypothetical protein [Paenibacillus sp. V4I9]
MTGFDGFDGFDSFDSFDGLGGLGTTQDIKTRHTHGHFHRCNGLDAYA